MPVYLTADQRVRHTHIIGSSGTGKSSLLFNLIQQDIENGEGVAVLDPHGDLINQILGIIPDDRIDDVVLVDPSDVDFPIGFNILSVHSDDEKNLLASDPGRLVGRLITTVERRDAGKWMRDEPDQRTTTGANGGNASASRRSPRPIVVGGTRRLDGAQVDAAHGE